MSSTRCVNCDVWQGPLHLFDGKHVCDECFKEQVPCFEVVWLCEPDEENCDGNLGAGMYEPRPNFHTEHDAMVYIKNEQLRSRAIIMCYEVVSYDAPDDELEFDRQIQVNKGEKMIETDKNIEWGSWE